MGRIVKLVVEAVGPTRELSDCFSRFEFNGDATRRNGDCGLWPRGDEKVKNVNPGMELI